jgi:membrane fusion protein (multidrug efflux system)
MFVREQVQEGIRQNGILAPQQGVTHNARGEATALVVDTDGKVQSRTLTTDRAIGNDWLVTKGLDDGDKLIVKGVQMVQPGIEVTANEIKLDDGHKPAAPSPDRVEPAAK